MERKIDIYAISCGYLPIFQDYIAKKFKTITKNTIFWMLFNSTKKNIDHLIDLNILPV